MLIRSFAWFLALIFSVISFSNLSARVIRVPFEYSAIQAALDVAVSGDSVVVAEGSYYEQLTIERRGVALVAESARPLVQGGVPVVEVLADSVLLVGFNIIAEFYSFGEPALLLNGNSLNVVSCIISGGWAGVLVLGHSEIVSTTIHDSAMGIQVALSGNEVVLRDCDILRNSTVSLGGGLSVINGNRAVLVDCRLIGNSASIAGGAIHLERDPSGKPAELMAERCVFAENSSANGAALESIGSNVTLRSCTIVANDPFGENGGVLQFEGSQPREITVDRCTVAFNDGPGLRCYGIGEPVVTCTNVFGNDDDALCGVDAGGNISLDPLFCGLDQRDFHLGVMSPCAPEHSPNGCGLIGALDVACASSVSPATWGSLKHRFTKKGKAP